MKCGVRFCGGCNPRFDRGKVLKEIEKDVDGVDFVNAVEGEVYDSLLIIGGCPSCCASYDHFNVTGNTYKIWDQNQLERIKKELIGK